MGGKDGAGKARGSDTSTSSASTMSFSDTLAAARRKFAASVKDSEEVMETLEVTNLAEMRELRKDIANVNKENAKKVIEKTKTTVQKGTWIAPSSGNLLVVPMAGKGRTDKGDVRRAKQKAVKNEEASSSYAKKQEPPKTSVFESPAVIALQRAVAREPVEDTDGLLAVEDTSKQSGKHERRRVKKLPPPEPKPFDGESMRKSITESPVVKPFITAQRKVSQTVDEKAEQIRRSADDARHLAEAKAEGAKLRAEHLTAETRRKTEEAKARAEKLKAETKRRAQEALERTLKAKAPETSNTQQAPPEPKKPPTLAEREIQLRKKQSAAARESRDVENSIAREKYELERRARVRERTRQHRAAAAADAERSAAKSRDTELRLLEEEKIQRELERSVKFAEVERAKRRFTENKTRAQTAFDNEERKRVEKLNEEIAKRMSRAVTKQEKEEAARLSRDAAREAKSKREEQQRRLEKEELDALRKLTSAMRAYDDGLTNESRDREAKKRAMALRHAEAKIRLKENRIAEENRVAAERVADSKDREKRELELEALRAATVLSVKKVTEDVAKQSQQLGLERKKLAQETAKENERIRREDELRRETNRKNALDAFEAKKAEAEKARIKRDTEKSQVRAVKDAELAKQKLEVEKRQAVEEEKRKKAEELFRAEKIKQASLEREKIKQEEAENEKKRKKSLTPQQREREQLKVRVAKIQERDAKIASGEVKSAFVTSAGVVLGHAGAALLIGAAFGAGSYLALKGAGATHRALTERSHRRRSGEKTPKPPRHDTKKDKNFKVPGSASTVFPTNRSSMSNNSSQSNTPVGTPRTNRTGNSPKSPNDDLDDVDLVSPLNSQRGTETDEKIRPREVKKPPGVPRLHLNRLTGEPSPPESKETTERWSGNGSNANSNNGTAASTPRTEEVSDMSHIADSLPNTARRAAEALASDSDLKQQLDEAKARLAKYEKVVKSERKAKMAAVEHAAKLAAAAEALAEDSDVGFSLTPRTIAADVTEKALMSPRSRDNDDALALASMREKERQQFEKAEVAIAKARENRLQKDQQAEEERQKWERVLHIANTEAGKAAEEASEREEKLREMFAKQKERTESLNDELKRAGEASKKADVLAKDAAKKAKAADDKVSAALKEEEAQRNKQAKAQPGELTPRSRKADDAEVAAKKALQESTEKAKEAADAKKLAEKKTAELVRVTKAAEHEIKDARKKAEGLKKELEKAVRDLKDREKQHNADMKRRDAAHSIEVQNAKKDFNKKVERVSQSAASDLQSALERERKLRDDLKKAEGKEKALMEEQKRLLEERRRTVSSGSSDSYTTAQGSGGSSSNDNTQQLVSKHALEIEELRQVHAADLEKRGGALRTTREQLQQTSSEIATLRDQHEQSQRTAKEASDAVKEYAKEASERAKAVEQARDALQDAVSLAVASGASEEEVVKAMRKRGVHVERLESGELKVVKG